MNRNDRFWLTPNLTLLIGHPRFGGVRTGLSEYPEIWMSDERGQIWGLPQTFILFFMFGASLDKDLRVSFV